MPGVVGAVESAANSNLQGVLDRIIAPLRQGFEGPHEQLVSAEAGWALGRVHRGIFASEPQLVSGLPRQALFHGELYNEPELRNWLRERGDEPPAGVAPVLLALHRHLGADMAARLEGAFAAVVLDAGAGELTLITDAVGSYPLYWFAGPTRFVFASALRAVLKDPAVEVKLNPQALADYLTFGFLIGEKTLAEAVELVPPASAMTVHWRSGLAVSQPRRYWHAASAFEPTSRPRSECFEALIHAFSRAVNRPVPAGATVGVSLSGGLDSRTILGALERGSTPVATYTLGVRGCADQVIAAQLAQIAGSKHTFFELNQDYLGEFHENLRAMIVLTDGMYLSHGLTEMLAFRFLERSGIQVLLRGHGGELAKTSRAWPMHTDEHVHGMRSAGELVPYLIGRMSHVGREDLLPQLFTGEWAGRMAGQARRSLSGALEGIDLSPAKLTSYIYLNEVHRRFTIPSIDLFRHVLDVRLPYTDVDYLKILLSMPPTWREGYDIHRAIVQAKLPALLKVRNSNTGAAAGASPLVESFLDKVNTVLKRLNVHGYRHYHNFDAWMQKSLLETVESVLLSRQSLDRGMIQEGTLRRLIDETRSGSGDHGYLFQVLLLVEIWLRENA